MLYTKNFNTAVLYTCGTCNLNCRYCGIDKNPILKKIDEALEKSFEGDYYFNQIKKIFPNRGQLKRLETWGGEPFWHMERIHPLVHQIIAEYPYFNEMFSSTNFSYDSWVDKFFGLMDQFGKYDYRDFKYSLQLSIDGPEYINDANRGNGVTQKCLNNFYKLLDELEKGRLPKNIELTIALKATLDTESLYNLNFKEKLIEYFQFFEEKFEEPFNRKNLKNVSFINAHPNTAVPSPITKEDGQMFANICKLTREIEKENENNCYFKYYKTITLFESNVQQKNLTYNYPHHTCGSGTILIGFLPDNMFSTCHEGFTHFIEEYKQMASNSNRVNTSTISFDNFLSEQKLPFCVDYEGLEEHNRKMMMYDNPNTSARLAMITNQILMLAMAGQIEDRYLDQVEALKGAIFIQERVSYCIKDNYNKTGSFTLLPPGMLKLLLNGAMEYIQMGKNQGGMCNGCNFCK